MKMYDFTIILIVLGLTSDLSAQENLNIRKIETISTNDWENYATTIASEGRFAYVAIENSGLKVVDVSNASFPTEMGSVNLDVSFFEIVVQRSIGYVAAGVNGLIIIDLIDPDDPRVLSQLRDVGNVRGVDVLADTAYVANGGGVTKVNCADPTAPSVFNVWRSDGFALKVKVSPPYGFVASREGGLEVFNLYQGVNPVGRIDAMGETRDLCITGEDVWLAETQGVSQIDVSNPREPARVVSRGTDYPVMAVAASEGKLFGAMPDGPITAVFDMTNQLAELSEIHFVANDIVADRNLIYLASDRPAPLKIFRIDRDDEPQKIGELGYQTIYRSVAKRGDYLYSAEWPNHLAVYSLADSSRPELIWKDMESAHSESFSQDMLVRDTLLFLFDQNLSIYNLITPEAPELISVVDLNQDGPHHLTIADNRLFCQFYSNNQINVIDISNPRNPSSLGNVIHQGDGYLCDIKVDGNFAYIIAKEEALLVFDISDLRDVRMVDRIATRGEPWSLELVGDHLYVCTLSELEIFDISDPIDLNILGSIYLGVDDPEATIVGDHVYIAGYGEGIRIFDITNLASIKEVGRYDTEDYAWDIETNDGILYVADYGNLGVYDCSAALSVTGNSFIPYPSVFAISAFPNPFNSSTTISYSIPVSGRTRIEILDLNGRVVTRLSDGWREAGSYREVLNGGKIASGQYLIRMNSNRESQTTPITLIK